MLARWRNSKGQAYFGVWETVFRYAILLWLLCFTLMAIPEFKNYSPQASYAMNVYDFVIRIFFLLEFFTRLIVSRHRLKYLFSFMGIIDLLVCLPVILILEGMNPEEVHYSFRMVQLLCIFKLARFNKALDPLKKAFGMIRNEFVAFVVVFCFLLYFLGMGTYLAEREVQPEHFASILDGLWFGVETLTTVGYGDIVPVTPMGKLFSGCIMFLGIALIAIPTGLITSAITRIWQQKEFLNTMKQNSPAKSTIPPASASDEGKD